MGNIFIQMGVNTWNALLERVAETGCRQYFKFVSMNT